MESCRYCGAVVVSAALHNFVCPEILKVLAEDGHEVAPEVLEWEAGAQRATARILELTEEERRGKFSQGVKHERRKQRSKDV